MADEYRSSTIGNGTSVTNMVMAENKADKLQHGLIYQRGKSHVIDIMSLQMFYEFVTYQDNISVYYIPPYTPLIYSKTGICRGIPIFFLFLLQSIDCGYSLEPPRRGGSNVYSQSMFLAKY